MAWLAALLALGACQQAPHFNSRDISSGTWGEDFSLTAHTGQPQRLSDYRGKVVLLFFGYTHCPDICAPTLSKLAVLQRRLGSDAAQVQIVFVTLDPAHDTPAQLTTFLSSFDVRFIGLTGSPGAVQHVAAAYKVAYQNGTDGTVDHSGSMFVIDRRGRVRLLGNNEIAVDALLHDVEILLRE